jgi:hypothetical protein
MFKEKGVVLRSALASNLKVIIGLWPDENTPTGQAILAKPLVRRMNRKGTFKTNQLYKAWLDPREVRALIAALERAAVLMDEHVEGTIDLSHLLAEDEDARLFVGTESVMYPTIDGMFDMTEHLEKEKEKLEEEDDDF